MDVDALTCCAGDIQCHSNSVAAEMCACEKAKAEACQAGTLRVQGVHRCDSSSLHYLLLAVP